MRFLVACLGLLILVSVLGCGKTEPEPDPSSTLPRPKELAQFSPILWPPRCVADNQSLFVFRVLAAPTYDPKIDSQPAGAVISFNNQNGVVRWKTLMSITTGSLCGIAGLTADQVVAWSCETMETSNYGQPIAFELTGLAQADGKVLWSWKSSGYMSAFQESIGAVTSGDTVVALRLSKNISEYASIVAVNTKTHQARWDRSDLSPTATPTIIGGKVVVLTRTGLYCLELSNGKTVWRQDAPPTRWPVAIHGQSVYWTAYDTLKKASLATGAIEGTLQLPEDGRRALICQLSDSVLVMAKSHAYEVDFDLERIMGRLDSEGFTLAIGTGNGKVLIVLCGLDPNDMTYQWPGKGEPRVHWADIRTGKFLTSYDLNQLVGEPLLVGKRIYLPTKYDRVFVVDLNE